MKKIINFFTKWFEKYTIYTESEPYALSYTNDEEQKQKAVLFGCNDYLNETNFGSNNLKVNCLDYKVSYEELLQQSSAKPFKISRIRICFNNLNRDWYIKDVLHYKTHDVNGAIYTKPFVFLNAIDRFQFQESILDITYFYFNKIDGNSHFEFMVKEKSTLTILVYPLDEKQVGYFEYKKWVKERRSLKNKQVHVHTQFDLKMLLKQLFNYKYWIN